jgi:hypothetical protein
VGDIDRQQLASLLQDERTRWRELHPTSAAAADAFAALMALTLDP